MCYQIQLRERASYCYCARSWRQQTNPSRKKFSIGLKMLWNNWLIRQLCVHRDNKDLGSLESTQEANLRKLRQIYLRKLFLYCQKNLNTDFDIDVTTKNWNLEKHDPLHHLFCLTSLCDWFRKVTPISQPNRYKSKTIHDLVALVVFSRASGGLVVFTFFWLAVVMKSSLYSSP